MGEEKLSATSSSNNMDRSENLRSLDEKADVYFTAKALGPDRRQIRYIREEVIPHCKGPKTLELGYGNGVWTEELLKRGLDLTVVEGSARLAQAAKAAHGYRARIYHSLFEEFESNEKFDTIVASCVLEHVVDPEALLRKIRLWAHGDSDIHLTVPNALSLHRRIGLKMGLLKDCMELSPQDIEIGHHTSYTVASFKEQLDRNGFVVRGLRGIFLKPVNSALMMDWSAELMDSFNEIAEELPEYSAFLYAQCSLVR